VGYNEGHRLGTLAGGPWPANLNELLYFQTTLMEAEAATVLKASVLPADWMLFARRRAHLWTLPN